MRRRVKAWAPAHWRPSPKWPRRSSSRCDPCSSTCMEHGMGLQRLAVLLALACSCLWFAVGPVREDNGGFLAILEPGRCPTRRPDRSGMHRGRSQKLPCQLQETAGSLTRTRPAPFFPAFASFGFDHEESASDSSSARERKKRAARVLNANVSREGEGTRYTHAEHNRTGRFPVATHCHSTRMPFQREKPVTTHFLTPLSIFRRLPCPASQPPLPKGRIRAVVYLRIAYIWLLSHLFSVPHPPSRFLGRTHWMSILYLFFRRWRMRP